MTMKKRTHLKSSVFGLICCLSLLSLGACSLSPGSPVGGNGTPTATSSPGKSASPTSQVPSTDTSCPTTGLARAAVMQPLTLDNQPDLVYNVTQGSSPDTARSVLRNYNVATGQASDISSTNGSLILQAQISSDGQWILFLRKSQSADLALLQLVRVDGQDLQTLTCLPYVFGGGPQGYPDISFLWSADEKTIVFSVDTLVAGTATSTANLLDVATGNLKPLLLDTENAQFLYYYKLVSWLDNTHVYIIKQGFGSPLPPADVFLMDITKSTVVNPDLHEIVAAQSNNTSFTIDSDPVAGKLFSGYCISTDGGFGVITVISTTGGTPQTIYSSDSDCVLAVRVISDDALFVLVQTRDAAGNVIEEFLSMNYEGEVNGPPVTLAENTTVLGSTSQFPWTNFARQSDYYALADQHDTTGADILVGSLKQGAPRSVATTVEAGPDSVIVGWTTM
jgi:hypothetical protein